MIELGEPVVVNETTEQLIRDAVVLMTGNSSAVASVVIVVDDKGRAVSVVVSVECDDSEAEALVEVIKGELGNDNCGFGVLCRAANVFVERKDVSDGAPAVRHAAAVCVLLFVELIAHRL